jgi:hypothetical protein
MVDTIKELLRKGEPMSDRRNRRIRAHFDGQVLVPEEPLSLPLNERLIVSIEPEVAPDVPDHGTAAFMQNGMREWTIDDGDAELMRSAIEDACERIDPDTDIDLDARGS